MIFLTCLPESGGQFNPFGAKNPGTVQIEIGMQLVHGSREGIPPSDET